MAMTIPEWWLADAKYPVVVDPVVGSSVVGAYNSYMYMTQEGYWEYARDKGDDPSALPEWYANMRSLEFTTGVVLNKYTTPAPMNRWYNTFLYIENVPVIQGYSYVDYAVAPLLYSDDTNHPEYLLNYENSFANILGMSKPGSFIPRWNQSMIQTDGSIAANTDIWFGYCGRNGVMRFDYGAPFFQSQDYVVDLDVLEEYGNYFEMAHDWNLYDISDMEDDQSGVRANVFPGARYDMKVSMYLAIPASYTRTVTQWVKPTETRKLTGKYQRSVKQTAQGTADANRFEGFCRRVEDTAGSATYTGVARTVAIRLIVAVAALYETEAGGGFNRGIGDTAGNSSRMSGTVAFFRALFGFAENEDSIGSFITYRRLIQDTETMKDETGHTADYLRGLFVEAGSIAGNTHRGEYRRIQQDTAGSEAVPLRHLFIFLRLLTGASIRDYIIGRFLKSKEELIIKSPVCREIILDSKLH
jgi:hypothetical protein